MWKLNDNLLNNPWVIEKKFKNDKYFDQLKWKQNISKVMGYIQSKRGNLVELNTYFKKEEKFQFNN